jgi:hypothetical protein
MKSRTFIYAVRMGATHAVKIGITGDVRKRMKQMQTGTPTPLHLITMIAVANAAAVERRIHERLGPYHIRGEWFAVATDADVIAIVDEMIGNLPPQPMEPSKLPPHPDARYFIKHGYGTLSFAMLVDDLIAAGATDEEFDKLFKKDPARFAKERRKASEVAL